jgi:hypothetical protein
VRFKQGDDVVLRRIIVEGAHSYMKSINPRLPIGVLELSGGDDLQIIGVMIGKWVYALDLVPSGATVVTFRTNAHSLFLPQLLVQSSARGALEPTYFRPDIHWKSHRVRPPTCGHVIRLCDVLQHLADGGIDPGAAHLIFPCNHRLRASIDKYLTHKSNGFRLHTTDSRAPLEFIRGEAPHSLSAHRPEPPRCRAVPQRILQDSASVRRVGCMSQRSRSCTFAPRRAGWGAGEALITTPEPEVTLAAPEWAERESTGGARRRHDTNTLKVLEKYATQRPSACNSHRLAERVITKALGPVRPGKRKRLEGPITTTTGCRGHSCRGSKQYQRRVQFGLADTVSPLAFPELKGSVKEIFGLQA